MDEASMADIYLRLGRIEGKLDSALKLEPRVRSLESGRAWLMGASATVSAFIAMAFYFFTGK